MLERTSILSRWLSCLLFFLSDSVRCCLFCFRVQLSPAILACLDTAHQAIFVRSSTESVPRHAYQMKREHSWAIVFRCWCSFFGIKKQSFHLATSAQSLAFLLFSRDMTPLVVPWALLGETHACSFHFCAASQQSPLLSICAATLSVSPSAHLFFPHFCFVQGFEFCK